MDCIVPAFRTNKNLELDGEVRPITWHVNITDPDRAGAETSSPRTVKTSWGRAADSVLRPSTGTCSGARDPTSPAAGHTRRRRAGAGHDTCGVGTVTVTSRGTPSHWRRPCCVGSSTPGSDDRRPRRTAKIVDVEASDETDDLAEGLLDVQQEAWRSVMYFPRGGPQLQPGNRDPRQGAVAVAILAPVAPEQPNAVPVRTGRLCGRLQHADDGVDAVAVPAVGRVLLVGRDCVGKAMVGQEAGCSPIDLPRGPYECG